MTALLWVAETPNVKTGRIPTGYVGSSRDETAGSCRAAECPRLDAGTCYAWTGATGTIALARLHDRSAAMPGRYGLGSALRRRAKDARAVRLAALGDLAGADEVEVRWSMRVVRRAGLAWLAYTHGWRRRALQDVALASCDSLEEADQAARLGYVAAAVVPAEVTARRVTTPDGRELVVCPAIRLPEVTCNACRLCDPAHPVWRRGDALRQRATLLAGVAFPEHGRHVHRRLGRRLPNAGAQRPWKGSTAR